MITDSLYRLLCILAVSDGRTKAEILEAVQCSRSSFNRDLAALRDLGVEIEYDWRLGVYCVHASGVFDLEKVKALTLESES